VSSDTSTSEHHTCGKRNEGYGADHFAIKLSVQMTEHPPLAPPGKFPEGFPAERRRKSDHHIVDLPTVGLATIVVALLVVACVVRLVSH